MPRRKPILAEPDQSVQIMHEQGRWPLLALSRNQCRFICTPHYGPRDGHLYCGRPTDPDASTAYCAEHRAIMYGPGTISERAAGEMTREMAA